MIRLILQTAEQSVEDLPKAHFRSMLKVIHQIETNLKNRPPEKLAQFLT